MDININPIAVILVYMDSKGDRLLYRYPYQQQMSNQLVECVANVTATTTTAAMQPEIPPPKKRNPYAISNPDDLLQTPPQSASNICISKGQLQGFADEALSTLLAVKQQLCNQKFELKVNDVRFVSHPTLLQRKDHRPSISAISAATGGSGISAVVGAATQSAALTAASGLASNQINTQTNTTATVTPTPVINAPKALPQQMLINIVFALHAQVSYSIVKCYYELSKRLGLALKVEEQRVGYLTDETVQMARSHDEISTQQQPPERAFDLISERCSLAQALKAIYHDLCTTGLLTTTINQNLTLSFCLPQKAHQLHKKGSMVDPETIDRCLSSLKPYHGMLLLVDFTELLDCVPPMGARMLLQLVEVYTPLTSLQSMASDADLNIEHVNKLVSHLVYWAKATIIYPLCETNVYVIAPDAPLHTKSHLVEKFSMRFPGMSLFEVISDFSLPTSIGHLTTPLQQPARQGILAQMVLWMLQHHLLMQLHTYVQFMPSSLDVFDTDAADIEHSASMMELRVGDIENGDNLNDVTDEAANGGGSGAGLVTDSVIDNVDLLLSSQCGNGSDDELNAGSLLSMSSQPLPVPHTSRRSITEDHFSATGSMASDNIVAQPSSSHKSNFSMTASISTENCDSIASIEDEEKIKELLQIFAEPDRAAIRRIPASMNIDDLTLMVKLYQAGYFKSEHHLEEIMYEENLRRSQLLQLLDKFREVLIIYETEDPAIASMYNTK